MESVPLLLILQLVIVFICCQMSDGALCKRPVDIAFAIDASGSVGSWRYYQEKDFVRKAVREFGISRLGTHAAVIVYSTSARVVIPFLRYYSYPSFYYAVERLPYVRGVTRIDLALKVAAEDVFLTEGGSRKNVPKILIVMTDGFQTRTSDSVPLDKAVLPLRAKGVQVYALAIGPYTSDYELRLIVGEKGDIFRANTFSGLRNVIRRLATRACTNALPVAFAIYPLNKQTKGRDISARRAPTAYLSSVTNSPGPYGRPGGSFYLQGTSNSYLDFPNSVEGRLDTWSSISIFLWVYPESKPGPIVNYRRGRHGVGLWLSGTRLLEGHIYSRRNFYRRKLYFYRFLPRKWYYVGLMYDNNRGVAKLWVNGRVVSRARMSRIHLATQHPIRIGAVNHVQQYFKGRVTCLQIYGMVLNANQIATIQKKCAAKDQKDPCLSSPCKNGGSCIIETDEDTGYRCRCKPGYRGDRCEVKPTPRPTGKPTRRTTTRTTSARSSSGSTGRRISTPSATQSTTTPGTSGDGFRIEIVEYINRFRRLHGAGPLILSTRISVAAQNWAQTLVSRGTASIDPSTSYGTNVFTRVGPQTGLAQAAVITWYTSVKYYDWAKRKPKVVALPFIHLIWLSSNFVGVGMARSPNAKFYVVVYFDPMPGNKEPLLKDNVLPYTDVFILMQGVSCDPGYKKHEGTCYKYHVDKQTWEGALFQSAKENATLVSFHKSHEEAFVHTLVPPGEIGLIWTGLNDRITEGTYTWSDGTSVEYTTWKANEPTGEKEDCVAVKVTSYGSMSDVPCTELHYFVSRQPLEGLITYRTRLQLVSLLWTDEYSQSTSLLHMELKQKIESLVLVIFQNDKTFVSGYVEEFSKNTKRRPQTTTVPTKPGFTSPGSQSTSSVSSGATARPSTGPTLSTQATPASTPTSSGVTTTKTLEKPTVKVKLILKFGPDVAPDPTKPIQDHLRKNLGRLATPVNHKTLIQSVRVVHPGVPPAVLGTCTSSCLSTCLITCNPFCCNSKIAATNNYQYSGMRHAVIARAASRGFIMPNLRPQINTLPAQVVAPKARLMSYPVTLSVRCVPHFLRPCPPGTQVAQTVQGSYKILPPAIPGRTFQPQPRPVVSLPQLTMPRAPSLMLNYPNQQAFVPRMFASSMKSPCIPSAYQPCPPPKSPTSVVDSPLHVMHLPPAQPPSSLMQPPCVPSVYSPCPPPKKPPVPVVDSPLHIIHLPPATSPSNIMQPPCIPSAYTSCPPLANPTLKPKSVVDSPVHVIHLPPAPPAPLSPPPLFFPRPPFLPVMCIPRPYYPCPPNFEIRKLSKPSHKKGKSRAFMPKPVASSYRFPFGFQQFVRPLAYSPFAPQALSIMPKQQPAQYAPQPYGFRPQFQFYTPPVWAQFMQRPYGMPPWATPPKLPNGSRKDAAANDKPKQQKQSQPKPIPTKGPISLQGSILVYPNPAPAVRPMPPRLSSPCIPSPVNPCVPFRPYPMAPNPFPVVNPCIPSLANPCFPTQGKPITKPTTKMSTPNSPKSKPILLTRPLQLQGSVYINSRPAPPGPVHPGTAPCIPTATKPCNSLMPPRPPLQSPSSYVAPRVLSPFFSPMPAQIPQQAVRNVAPYLFNSNPAQQVPAAPHSFVVQLPEISLSYSAPAPSSPLPVVPPLPSNCPISCIRYPGPFCPPYCAASCCRKKSGNKTYSKKKTERKPKETKKGKKPILKVKKTKKG